jgi:hypothetical protein
MPQAASVSNSSGSNPTSPKFAIHHSPLKTDVPALPLYQKSRTLEKPASNGNYSCTGSDGTNNDNDSRSTHEDMMSDADLLLDLNKFALKK